jgi:hypothetical protein
MHPSDKPQDFEGTPKNYQEILISATSASGISSWALFLVMCFHYLHSPFIIAITTVQYLISTLLMIWVGYRYMQEEAFSIEFLMSNRWPSLPFIRIACSILLLCVFGCLWLLPALVVAPSLWLLRLSRSLYQLKKSQNWETSDISSSNTIIQYMYNQIDIEWKACLIDQKSEWINLTPKQVQIKEILFILDYYRGVLIHWSRTTISRSLLKMK